MNTRHQIDVDVESTYLEEQSAPAEHRYVFAYTVTLRNALGGLLSAAQIGAAGIDPGARAETLAAADFGRLALAVAGAAPL